MKSVAPQKLQSENKWEKLMVLILRIIALPFCH